jgi:tetratricopeptide (TPR) repeat protein
LRLALALTMLSVLAAPSGGQVSSMGDHGVSVVVRVETFDGGPLEVGADVFLNPEGGKGLDEQTGTTSEAQFDRVAAGHYEIQAEARGYEPGHATLLVDNSRSAFYVTVTLKRDSSQATQPNAAGTLLAPKARKEMEAGVAAIKSGKYQDAQKHLQAAYKLAPGDADINYLLGFAHAALKQNDEAQKYLSAAISLRPQHVPTLVALGNLDLETGNVAHAEELLEKAISIDSSNWKAHWLLAEAYEKDRNHEKAAQEAESAVEFGKAAADGAQLVLGKALAALGRRKEAIQAFQAFLAAIPDSPLKDAVQREIALLNSQLAAVEQSKSSQETVSTNARRTPYANTEAIALDTVLAAPLVSPAPSLPNWGPPSIAQSAPAISQSKACPASQVIEGTSSRVVEFVSHMNNINATEELVHEKLDDIGKPVDTKKLHFDYLVTIAEVQPGILRVDELRNGTPDPDLFPENLATLGVPAFALVFHPALRGDFDMTCEGLGILHGQPAWIVRFAQKNDRPSRLREYRIHGISHPVSMQGRVWIAPDTFQIMRLETDLVHPMPEIQLTRDYTAVEYSPVQFRAQGAAIWLPSSAELYFEVHKQRYHRSETLTHYRLFSVGATQKINQPDAQSNSQ